MYQPATNSKQCYALRHGYDFIFDTNAATSSLNPWWRKVMATKKYLPFYDWVFWMDADTLVTNYTVRLEWFLPENDADTHLVVTDHNIALNDGAFFLRNSDWSTRHGADTIDVQFEVHNRGQRWAWDDQGAFYELLLIEAHSSPGHVEYDNECSRSNRCCEYLPLQRCFNRRLEQTGSVFGDRHVPHVTFIDPRYHPVPSEPGNAWVRGGFDQYREVEFQGEVWIYGEWSKENFWHRGDFVLHSSAKSFMKAFVPDAFTDSCALALAMDVPPRRTLKLQRPPVT
ncbi:hypothetical protein PBRA_006659 [Plasmodiophora brassicae]|uniref:Uncharacterized protein n=1 Tax=Plasmodiophora brassicae TaxID=37360 RepID=A0A0G4ITF2_PLABS|nr:hypothetical protein PBRA_006659 [Plasmodiophora brassicae]